MAKILTMTIFMRPKGVKYWRATPSFTGKVILCDDMRIYGFVDKYRGNHKTSEMKYFVEGAAVKRAKLEEDEPDTFAFGFFIKLDGIVEHALSSKIVTFNKLSDGYYGNTRTTEHDTIEFVNKGDIRVNIGPYIAGINDDSAPDEKKLTEISRAYQDLSGLAPHNEQLHTSANYWRQIATA